VVQVSARTFDLCALPRVRGGDLEASRRAAVRFGPGPRIVELTVARFGRVSLKFGGVMHAARPGGDESVWRLRRPGSSSSDSQGWLLLGHAAGLRLVSAILGIPSPRVHRPLGTTERGVLAAAISAVIRHAPGLAVAGARPGEWNGSGLGRIEGWAESETFRETFFLDVPPAWIPAGGPGAIPGGVVPIQPPICLAIELARTTITAEEWSRAGPGDAVVFDQPVGRGRPDESLSVRVVCGDFAAPAAVRADELTVTGGFSPHLPAERNHPMADDPDRDITTTVLAAAPIQLVAELGRVTLRADEVSALKGGAVISLPPNAESRVELRIGDRLWARGELVDLDGQLAVRLISVTGSRDRVDMTVADTLR